MMLVGEAPGAREDREGRPFVGAAGDLLDELLSAAGIARKDIYITNAVKCRPPFNRMPTKAEIIACRPHLEAQICSLRPKLICTLGAVALRSVLSQGQIMKSRGEPIYRNGILHLPTLHPAAALHNPKLRRVLFEDFRLLGRMISAGPDGLDSQLASARGIRTLDLF